VDLPLVPGFLDSSKENSGAWDCPYLAPMVTRQSNLLPLWYAAAKMNPIPRNKAVADGAISFYLDHFVTTRVAKHTYGTPCCTIYDQFDLEHKKRAHKTIISLSGDKVIPEGFASVLSKVHHLPLPFAQF
jgi:hypothetical protein